MSWVIEADNVCLFLLVTSPIQEHIYENTYWPRLYTLKFAMHWIHPKQVWPLETPADVRLPTPTSQRMSLSQNSASIFLHKINKRYFYSRSTMFSTRPRRAPLWCREFDSRCSRISLQQTFTMHALRKFLTSGNTEATTPTRSSFPGIRKLPDTTQSRCSTTCKTGMLSEERLHRVSKYECAL